MRTIIILFLALCSVACAQEAPKGIQKPWTTTTLPSIMNTTRPNLTVSDRGGPVIVITADGVVQHPSGKPIADMPRVEQLRVLCDAMKGLAGAYNITLTRCVD